MPKKAVKKKAGRPRKSQVDEPTAEAILDAAEAHFAKAGFRGASLAEIARSAGIQAPSVLIYHYKSKQALFGAVALRVCERGFSEIESACLAASDSTDRARNALDCAIAFAQNHQEIAQRILAEALGEGPFGPEIDQPVSLIMELLERSLRESINPPIPVEAPLKEALANLTIAFYTRLALAHKLPKFLGGQDQTAELISAFLTTLQNWSTVESDD